METITGIQVYVDSNMNLKTRKVEIELYEVKKTKETVEHWNSFGS